MSENLGCLPTLTLLESRGRALIWCLSGSEVAASGRTMMPLKPSFSFNLLSFQPRSNKVLSRDFFLHFSGSLEAPQVIFARSKPLPTLSGAPATVIGQKKSKWVKSGPI